MELTLKEQKQNYYEYRVDGSDWHRKEPPARSPLFEKELASFGGLNPFGQPILRVEWAGTLQSDVSAYPTLKYKKIWEGKEFYYADDEGRNVRVTHPDQCPKDKILKAEEKRYELGRLRWVIEAWQSTADAIRGGRFDPEKLGENGEPLFRKPPADGVYNAFFWIQSADGRYRDLDMGVLEAVKAMWHYAQTTPIDKKMRDFAEDEQRERTAAASDARNRWHSNPDPEEIERALEESAKEREFLTEAARRAARVII